MSVYTYTTLDDPMGDATVAYGINISGQIVGYYQTGNFFHGFLLSGGTYTTLDDPSAGQVQSQGTFAHGSAEIGGAGVIASLSLGC